jgi:predicted O-methyltransferase YrrM
MFDIDTVMCDLDRWVATQGNGEYMSPNWKPAGFDLTISPMFGCQQVREELRELGTVIAQQPWVGTGIGVEIGLGFYGSTHIFWRNFFSQIITVELSHDRVRQFSHETHKFYGNCVLDEKSRFVIGSSQDAQSVGKIYNAVDKIDFLFIDGDHRYPAVLSDWLLYAPLVKSGGIVAFHDTFFDDEDVPQLISKLRSGRFGRVPTIHDIKHSDCVGISYYVVE